MHRLRPVWLDRSPRIVHRVVNVSPRVLHTIHRCDFRNALGVACSPFDLGIGTFTLSELWQIEMFSLLVATQPPWICVVVEVWRFWLHHRYPESTLLSIFVGEFEKWELGWSKRASLFFW